jgi:hypothetical protein
MNATPGRGFGVSMFRGAKIICKATGEVSAGAQPRGAEAGGTEVEATGTEVEATGTEAAP